MAVALVYPCKSLYTPVNPCIPLLGGAQQLKTSLFFPRYFYFRLLAEGEGNGKSLQSMWQRGR